MGGDEEEQTPKGDDVRVDLEVTLKDLYLGHQFKARITPLDVALEQTRHMRRDVGCGIPIRFLTGT